MNIMEKVDITKPYFFVSYACVDEVQVYTDIRRLQNRGKILLKMRFGMETVKQFCCL